MSSPELAAAAPTDEALIEQILHGETAAFASIMRRYNQRLFRVVRSVVRNDLEAEDVLQETYVRAFEHLRQFEGRARFSTWLTRIALHEAFARVRRQRRTQPVDFSAKENDSAPTSQRLPSAEQVLSNRELGVVLASAVAELPADLRLVFVMRIVEGIDTAACAECLSLTEANVKVRLHRARGLLRRRIDAQLGKEVRELYQFGGERCGRIVRAVLARLVSAQ